VFRPLAAPPAPAGDTAVCRLSPFMLTSSLFLPACGIDSRGEGEYSNAPFKRRRIEYSNAHDRRQGSDNIRCEQSIHKFYVVADEDPLGQGSYGSVYAAHRKGDSQAKVAIKHVKERGRSLQDLSRSMQREIELTQANSHPNLIALHETLITTEGVYMVMERADQSLSDLLGRVGRLSWEEAFSVGMDLCQGLKQLHSRKIIHRDIKPDNLLLFSATNLDGTTSFRVKLADFSLARHLHSNTNPLAQDGEMTPSLSTRLYSAPEILLGTSEYGLAADMWACGLIIAECVCGSPLFTGESDLQHLMAIFHVIGFPTKEPTNSVGAPCAKNGIAIDSTDCCASIWPQFYEHESTDHSMSFTFPCDCPKSECNQQDCPFRHRTVEQRTSDCVVCERWGAQNMLRMSPNEVRDCLPLSSCSSCCKCSHTDDPDHYHQCHDATCQHLHPSQNCLAPLLVLCTQDISPDAPSSTNTQANSGIQLIEQLLVYDPSRRLTASAAAMWLSTAKS